VKGGKEKGRNETSNGCASTKKGRGERLNGGLGWGRTSKERTSSIVRPEVIVEVVIVPMGGARREESCKERENGCEEENPRP